MLVTDVPFWNGQTGAHARTTGLLAGLNQDPFRASVLLPQVTEENDNQRLAELASSYSISRVMLNQPPAENGGGYWRWRFDGACYLLQRTLKLAGLEFRNSAQKFGLDDYYSPAICRRFVSHVRAIRPDVILFNYLSQFCLLEALPLDLRKSVLAVLDSHDLLHRRTAVYKETGKTHWLSMSEQDEIRAARNFDLVIAIQDAEAQFFARHLGELKVITVGMEYGHSLHQSKSVMPAIEDDHVIVGHLASDNELNRQTVASMLRRWSEIQARRPGWELRIGGPICKAFVNQAGENVANGVKWLGPLETVDPFYEQVHVVWNPVVSGTGLKIKNVEAMAFGKFLVTSPHGAEGMVKPENDEYWVETGKETPETSSGEASWFAELSVAEILQYAERGREFAKKHWGPGTQYPKLRQKITSLLGSSSQFTNAAD